MGGVSEAIYITAHKPTLNRGGGGGGGEKTFSQPKGGGGGGGGGGGETTFQQSRRGWSSHRSGDLNKALAENKLRILPSMVCQK